MEDGLITTKEVGNYRIKIYYDTDSACPCESWDMAACFLWEYSDLSRLQDVCDWREVFGKYGDSRHSLIDALHKLISEYVEWKDLLNYFKKGKIDGYRMRYDNHDKMRYLEWYDNYQYTKHKGYKEIFSISPSDLYTYDYTYEFIEDLGCEELIQILSDLGKDIFVKEWSTRGYCQGDYIEGIAFCTKERYTKMVSNNTSDWETQIDKLIDDEVKSIGMWMWGDVKGYVLEKKVKFVKKYEDESRENVLKQLEEDVRFGFEKALNQRGISASLMFECVMMWNYILEEGLEGWSEDDYAFYGLPLFKATAVKYGWDNPIGEDSGRERKYDSQY